MTNPPPPKPRTWYDTLPTEFRALAATFSPEAWARLDELGATGDLASVRRLVAKAACQHTYCAHADRVEHFRERMAALGRSPEQVVITILNVDDVHGGPLADRLMPGYAWDAIRATGAIPYARGLATRRGIEDAVRFFDAEAADALSGAEGVVAVVVDFGVAAVFPVPPPVKVE